LKIKHFYALNQCIIIVSAIIGFNYLTPLQTQQPERQTSFFNWRDTVLLKEEDYTLVQRQDGFDLLEVNKTKLKKIEKLDNPYTIR